MIKGRSCAGGKVKFSWISPNLVYEDAMNLFLDEIMKEKPENNFINDFKTFQRFISACTGCIILFLKHY